MCGISRKRIGNPDISSGSEVRVIHKKDNKTKGYFPTWPKEVCKVTFVKDNEYIYIYIYMVNDGKRKVYQRRELLKV